MPRGKKESNKKKKSKDVEDSEESEDILEEEEEDTPKKSKKSSKTDKKKKKETTDEDELSDLDVDEEDGNDTAPDSGDNDEIVSSKPKRVEKPIKKIDPDIAIGSLKTDEILSFLIEKGHETLNPNLKYGALNLLKELTGKRRRQQYGSKRGGHNNYPRGFNSRGRGRGRYDGGYQPGSKSQLFASSGENLYEDN